MTEYSNSACLLALRHKTFMKNVNSAHVSVTFCELLTAFAVWWKFSLTCVSSQCDVRSRENSMLVSPRDPHPPPERNSQSYGSWECIHCKCLRPENEIVWGTVDEASKWRPECIHCRASTPLPPVSSRQQTPPRTGTPLSATMPRTGSPLGGGRSPRFQALSPLSPNSPSARSEPPTMRTFGGTGGLGGLGDVSVTRPLTTMSHVRQANSYEERLGISRRGLRGMTPITPSNRGYAVQIAAEIKAARKRGEDPPLPASSREAARPRPPLVSARGASLAPPSPASARLFHTDRLPNTAPARVRDGPPLSSAAPQSPRSPLRSPSPSGGGAPWNLSPWRLTAPYVDIDAKAYKWPVEGAGASMRGLTLHGSGGGGSPRGGISNGAGAHRRTSALSSRAGLDGGGAGAVVGQPSQRLDRAMMHQLLRETSMTRTELYRLFNRFKALCKLSGTPGSINKHMFKEGVSSLAFEDDNFVDRVWKLLDVDRSGAVEWYEFVNAVNALETGSALDKLRFCFRVYDTDNNESIDREELHAMFSSMLLCAPGTGTHIPEASPALNELIEDFVNSIYDSFDADRNSALDFSEVLEALKRKGNEISDPWEIFGRTLVSRT